MTTKTTEAAPTHETFGHALAAFQRNLPSIKKGNRATVPGKDGRTGYGYDYADLTDVAEKVLPLLAVHGLSWYSGLDTDDQGSIVLRWELMHESGTGRNGTLPIGGRGTPWQQLGSAITYARRYALTAATGVAPGGDDDDAQATAGSNAQPARPQQQAPVAAAPERLPEGLYDLATLVDYDTTVATYQKARAAGHLHLLVGVKSPDGTLESVPLGQWLKTHGESLAPAPDEQPTEGDAPAEEQ